MYSRTEKILGKEAINKLLNSKVAVFGVGGVGGFVCEGLVRAGIGEILAVDFDVVDESNKNRQIIALESTIGKKKVEVIKNRLMDINPKLRMVTKDIFIDNENINQLDISNFNYVVDAIDYIDGKVAIIKKCKEVSIPVISSMGMGNKLDPQKIEVADINKTSVCPLAKKMRKLLKSQDIKDVKTVFSREEPIAKLSPPGSVSFVPSVAGLIIAREVVLDLIKLK